MANSEANITSDSDGYVSVALRSLHLLGFAHAGTLAAMRGVSPVCPSARLPARVCASLSLSSARRLRSPSVRGPVCLPGGFPPTPQPQLVSHPPTHQHDTPHAAAPSAAWICTSRSALTRRGCRESERTPNHALQRTAPRVTVAAISSSNPSRPSVALSYARSLSLRSTTQLPRHAPPSLSLGSLGVLRPLFRELHQQ